MADDYQLEIFDLLAELAEFRLQRVERKPGVGAGVDQRQRIIVKQIRIDWSDAKWSREGNAVDAALAGAGGLA